MSVYQVLTIEDSRFIASDKDGNTIFVDITQAHRAIMDKWRVSYLPMQYKITWLKPASYLLTPDLDRYKLLLRNSIAQLDQLQDML